MSKMFSFITKNHNKNGDTWNPLGGECLHHCRYCWAIDLKNRYPNLKTKYSGKPRLYPKEFEKQFTEKDFVFVCDMTDLFGYWVPTEIIQQVFEYIAKSPAKFLLLTKNPKRYSDLIAVGVHIPFNCIIGATIESDLDHLITVPVQSRIDAMIDLSTMGYPVMVCVEPIMAFNLHTFTEQLLAIKPQFVAVGYDNYNNGLNEPRLAQTNDLIAKLENVGITVYKKTLREPLSICVDLTKDVKE